MRTANRTWPKTDFGIEVSIFCAQTGMNRKMMVDGINEYCAKNGIGYETKYSTLVETTTGRCAGHQLKPIARAFMQDYLTSLNGPTSASAGQKSRN